MADNLNTGDSASNNNGPKGQVSGPDSRGAFYPSPPDGQYIKAKLKGPIKLTKLNSENYLSWSDGMRLLLEAKGLWRVVSGSISLPDPNTRPIDNMNWKIDDYHARVWIYDNMRDSQHKYVEGLRTSNAMWEGLEKVHVAQNQGRLNFLLLKFLNYKAGVSDTIDEIASELIKLQRTIRSIDAKEAPPDRLLALILMDSIDNEAFTLAKYHLENQPNLSLTDTIVRLRLVEEQLRDKNSRGGETTNKSTPHRGSKRKCFHCNKLGHIRVNCRDWQAQHG